MTVNKKLGRFNPRNLRGRRKCKPGGPWCKWMESQLSDESPNSKARGLILFRLTNIDELTKGVPFKKCTRSVVGHRRARGVQAVSLRSCPWCGTNLEEK